MNPSSGKNQDERSGGRTGRKKKELPPLDKPFVNEYTAPPTRLSEGLVEDLDEFKKLSTEEKTEEIEKLDKKIEVHKQECKEVEEKARKLCADKQDYPSVFYLENCDDEEDPEPETDGAAAAATKKRELDLIQ